MKIRNALPQDAEAILALNADSVHLLSPMDAARLAHLQQEAVWHQVVELDGKVVGFVLAFREGADYDSLNYQWFAARYPQFLYIDRIVIGEDVRGLGVGGLLYERVLAFAQETGAPLLTCEYDVDPPNPVSEKFHHGFGFEEVGRQRLPNGKSVSLQAMKVG